MYYCYNLLLITIAISLFLSFCFLTAQLKEESRQQQKRQKKKSRKFKGVQKAKAEQAALSEQEYDVSDEEPTDEERAAQKDIDGYSSDEISWSTEKPGDYQSPINTDTDSDCEHQ